MRYLIDTTLLIDVANGIPAARTVFAALFEEAHDLCTCDAVTTEALSGGSDEQLLYIRSLLDALEYISTAPEVERHEERVLLEVRLADGLSTSVVDDQCGRVAGLRLAPELNRVFVELRDRDRVVPRRHGDHPQPGRLHGAGDPGPHLLSHTRRVGRAAPSSLHTIPAYLRPSHHRGDRA